MSIRCRDSNLQERCFVAHPRGLFSCCGTTLINHVTLPSVASLQRPGFSAVPHHHGNCASAPHGVPLRGRRCSQRSSRYPSAAVVHCGCRPNSARHWSPRSRPSSTRRRNRRPRNHPRIASRSLRDQDAAGLNARVRVCARLAREERLIPKEPWRQPAPSKPSSTRMRKPLPLSSPPAIVASTSASTIRAKRSPARSPSSASLSTPLKEIDGKEP